MKRIAAILFAANVAGAATVAHAQSATKQPVPSQKKNTIDQSDSVSIADVQRAADELARTVQAVAKKVAEDPKIKVAALKLATQSVNAAQLIVEQQAVTLQSLLDSLAKEMAAVTVSIEQKSRTKAH
jgi:hypothetical protein